MTDCGPILPPFSKHIFVCVGDKCAKAGQGEAVYEHLKERIRLSDYHSGPQRIHRSKTTCLGVCSHGPIAVVYPEGSWYRSLDVSKMDRIFDQHLIQGKKVQEFSFQPLDKQLNDDSKDQ